MLCAQHDVKCRGFCREESVNYLNSKNYLNFVMFVNVFNSCCFVI